MHAGNGHSILEAHQLGKHFGARNHRNVPGMCFSHFRIVGRNRRADDNDLGTLYISRAMAFHDGGAHLRQALRHRGKLGVGAGHLVAKIQQHLGNAAHPDAPDPDEMYALYPGKHLKTNSRQDCYEARANETLIDSC